VSSHPEAPNVPSNSSTPPRCAWNQASFENSGSPAGTHAEGVGGTPHGGGVPRDPKKGIKEKFSQKKTKKYFRPAAGPKGPGVPPPWLQPDPPPTSPTLKKKPTWNPPTASEDSLAESDRIRPEPTTITTQATNLQTIIKPFTQSHGLVPWLVSQKST